MSTLFVIILTTLLISLIAFVGALALFLKEELLERVVLFLVAFSAGALIGGAFLHLLPEGIERAGMENSLQVFLFAIFGFVAFFILENFIRWHHHHTRDCVDCSKVKPFSYLILISDGLHNFIDGLIIAASFVIAFPLGLVTALVVALHEIPQEIGDFAVLVYGGFEKTKALLLNFLSAGTAVAGGVIGFFLWEQIGNSVVFLLPFAAGNFIYIASSDLIPEIKQKTASGRAALYFIVFLLGLALMYGIRYLSLS